MITTLVLLAIYLSAHTCRAEGSLRDAKCKPFWFKHKM